MLVYGAELDGTWLGLSDTSDVTTNVTLPPFTTKTETKTDWLATLRGRVGVLVTPRSLVYLTGGLAGGHVKGSTFVDIGPTCAINNSCSVGKASDTLWGWTLGAGVEHAFASGWTLKVEYLYYDLGSLSYAANETSNSFPPALGTQNLKVETDVTGQILRAGVNYRF